MAALRISSHVFYVDEIRTEITVLFCKIINAFNFSSVLLMALSPVHMLYVGQKHTYLMSVSGISDAEISDRRSACKKRNSLTLQKPSLSY